MKGNDRVRWGLFRNPIILKRAGRALQKQIETAFRQQYSREVLSRVDPAPISIAAFSNPKQQMQTFP